MSVVDNENSLNGLYENPLKWWADRTHQLRMIVKYMRESGAPREQLEAYEKALAQGEQYVLTYVRAKLESDNAQER